MTPNEKTDFQGAIPVDEWTQETLRSRLSDTVADDTISTLVELLEDTKTRTIQKPEPASEQVSYPDSMTALDRVLHVLKSESRHAVPLPWLSTAATVPEDDCLIILSVLATTGIVIPDSGTALSGYRLNPYFEFYNTIERDVDSQNAPDFDQ